MVHSDLISKRMWKTHSVLSANFILSCMLLIDNHSNSTCQMRIYIKYLNWFHFLWHLWHLQLKQNLEKTLFPNSYVASFYIFLYSVLKKIIQLRRIFNVLRWWSFFIGTSSLMAHAAASWGVRSKWKILVLRIDLFGAH